MLKLAERCEQATGPDRELDVYIALVTGELEHSEFYEPEQLYGAECHAYNGPDYTASLDAAMTLVPEGWGYSICPKSTLLTRGSVSGRQESHMGRGAVPALALCAAALRARSA